MALILNNQNGIIEISDDAIITLAGMATSECYGIVGMTNYNTVSSLTELIKKDNVGKGIKIHMDGDFLTVDLYVVIEYGVKISAVAQNVVDKITYMLKEYLKYDRIKVNVNVMSVRV